MVPSAEYSHQNHSHTVLALPLGELAGKTAIPKPISTLKPDSESPMFTPQSLNLESLWLWIVDPQTKTKPIAKPKVPPGPKPVICKAPLCRLHAAAAAAQGQEYGYSQGAREGFEGFVARAMCAFLLSCAAAPTLERVSLITSLEVGA